MRTRDASAARDFFALLPPEFLAVVESARARSTDARTTASALEGDGTVVTDVAARRPNRQARRACIPGEIRARV